MLGAWYPEVFTSIGAMSGSFDRRIFEAVRHNTDAILQYKSRFHISCGSGDESCEISRALANAFKSEHIQVEFYENPGTHDWDFWGPSAAGNIEFHWWNFQK